MSGLSDLSVWYACPVCLIHQCNDAGAGAGAGAGVCAGAGAGTGAVSAGCVSLISAFTNANGVCVCSDLPVGSVCLNWLSDAFLCGPVCLICVSGLSDLSDLSDDLFDVSGASDLIVWSV